MPEQGLSNNLVNLIGHLAWPVTLLIALLLIRRHKNAILTALSVRIRTPESDMELVCLVLGGLSISAAKSVITTTTQQIISAIAQPAACKQPETMPILAAGL